MEHNETYIPWDTGVAR